MENNPAPIYQLLAAVDAFRARIVAATQAHQWGDYGPAREELKAWCIANNANVSFPEE
jgi:hypothetical protein